VSVQVSFLLINPCLHYFVVVICQLIHAARRVTAFPEGLSYTPCIFPRIKNSISEWLEFRGKHSKIRASARCLVEEGRVYLEAITKTLFHEDRLTMVPWHAVHVDKLQGEKGEKVGGEIRVIQYAPPPLFLLGPCSNIIPFLYIQNLLPNHIRTAHKAFHSFD
jgi:hypothetical protein